MANFGSPLSLTQWLDATSQSLAVADRQLRRDTVGRLGEALAEQIEALIPVLPVALLAQVLLQAEDGISELQLKRDALALADRLRAALKRLSGRG